MAPSNPKRPPRPPRPPGPPAPKKQEVELPFDDDEIAPLQADDPRPQRVPQFPAGPRRRSARTSRGAREDLHNRELAARFDAREYTDPGHSPASLYVEKGPGLGQLVPVKQGPLVIGRASACDLRLQHPSISRRHAQLMRQGERFLLRDLGSQNGTFVNRVKLTGDTEIHIGDEIAVGNAVLKLRGTSVSSDQIPQASVAGPASGRKVLGLPRVALLAAGAGSLVAALLTLAALKFTGARETVAPATGSSTGETYVPPPPATDEEEQAAGDSEASRAPSALKSRKETSGTSGSKASRASATAKATSRATTKASEGKASEGKATDPAGAANRADILARFEKGEVDAALSLAREARLEPLATRIAAFQTSEAAGRKALAAGDTAAAIQHLTAALAVDHELTQGWGVQGPRLRAQLSQLHVRSGRAHLKAGDARAARESFALALKYDAANAQAKTELERVGKKK